MKKTICCTVVILMILSILVGCNSRNSCRVYKKDGQYYLDVKADPTEKFDGMWIPPDVYFHSVNEMLNDIRTGNFTEDEFRHLADLAVIEYQEFYRTDIPLPDLDHLYEPSLSDDWDSVVLYDTYLISWVRTSYKHRYRLLSPYSCSLWISAITETSYDTSMEQYSSPNTYKKHTVSAGDSEYTVFISDSQDTKSNVYILGFCNGTYFMAELPDTFQVPSDEMIAGIGMVPFMN